MMLWRRGLLAVLALGLAAASERTPAPIHVVSFNIQFLGNFKDRQNDVLAEILSEYDLVFVQELVAPPDACTFPDGTPCKKDPEAAAFFSEMAKVGYSWILSPEDTGTGPENHKNSAATEWFVAFYKPDRLSPEPTLPSGFLAADRSDNPSFERVPYAFAFRADDESDLVFISTHLNPGGGGADTARRAEEFAAIYAWINDHNETEQDFVILGDMNIEDCEELADVTPDTFRSLNDTCIPTNTNPNGPKPYDHVIYSPANSGNEIGDVFTVLNLVELVRPHWDSQDPFPGDPYDHNKFRTRFSDHHPVYFQILPTRDDD